MKTLYESILDDDIKEGILDDDEDFINNMDKSLFIKQLNDKFVTQKEYDKLWKAIISNFKLRPVDQPNDMINSNRKNFILIGYNQFGDIKSITLYKSHTTYPKVRSFYKDYKYGPYAEYNLDVRDGLEYLFDENKVFYLPKELEWLWDIKK